MIQGFIGHLKQTAAFDCIRKQAVAFAAFAVNQAAPGFGCEGGVQQVHRVFKNSNLQTHMGFGVLKSTWNMRRML